MSATPPGRCSCHHDGEYMHPVKRSGAISDESKLKGAKKSKNSITIDKPQRFHTCESFSRRTWQSPVPRSPLPRRERIQARVTVPLYPFGLWISFAIWPLTFRFLMYLHRIFTNLYESLLYLPCLYFISTNLHESLSYLYDSPVSTNSTNARNSPLVTAQARNPISARRTAQRRQGPPQPQPHPSA